MRKRYLLERDGVLVQKHSPFTWALSQVFVVGDLSYHSGSTYICTVAHTAVSGYEPGVGADWEDVFEAMATGSGDFAGPDGAVDGNLMAFNGATGKLGKDSGVSAVSGHIEIPAPASGGTNSYVNIGTYLRLMQAYAGGNAFLGWNARLSTSAAENKFAPAYNPGKGFLLQGDYGNSLAIHSIDWGSSSAEKTFPADFTKVLDLDYLGNLTVPYLKDTKLGQSQHYVTVGPHTWCDYVTDGTDDQVQLQAALTDGGTGVVVVVTGLLNITAGSHPYTTAIGQTIIGTGWGIEDDGTSHMGLKLVGAGTGPVFEIEHRMTTIRDLSINGGHAEGHTGCYGIKWATLYAWQTTIDHCYIHGCGDSGIYIDLEGSGMASVVKNCFVRKIYAGDGWAAGIKIVNTHDLKMDTIEIAEADFCLMVTGTSAANFFDNMHMWPYYTTGNAICLYIDSSGPGNEFHQCYFDNHGKSVVLESAANNNLISGCYSAGFNRASCVGITLNGDYNRIVNNNLPNESNMSSAMEINGDYNIVLGNIVHGKAINDYGTGNEKAHNI